MFDLIQMNSQRFLMNSSFDFKNTRNSEFLKMVLKNHKFDNNIENSIPIKINQNQRKNFLLQTFSMNSFPSS